MTGFFAISSIVFGNHGGDWRTRTVDLLRVKHDSNTAVLAARAESLAQQGFLSAVVCPYISFSLVSTPIFF